MPEEKELQSGERCLIHACIRNRPREAEILLSQGVFMKSQDENGYTPLHYAVRFKSIECVELLLQNGATDNVINSAGETALCIAVREGHEVITGLLLDCGSCPNFVNIQSGQTILSTAIVSAKSEKIVKQLLDAGANPRIKDSDDCNAYQLSKKHRSPSFKLVAEATLEHLTKRD